MIVAVLDACVLVPSVLADTLLRCAERELFWPIWSDQILDEVRRNLPTSVEAVAAERRINTMRRFFPRAMVSGYETLAERMTNHPKDRHVLAAAVKGNAERIVTANLRDFPIEALDPYAIEAQHPDDFLCDLLDNDPDQIVEIITEQAAATGKAGRPKLTVADVLEGLTGCNVVRFPEQAALVGRTFGCARYIAQSM